MAPRDEELERLLGELDAPDPWQWWYRLVTITILLMLTWVGLALLFGPVRWTTGNSIAIIHHHSQWLPIKAYSAPFLAAAVMILWERTRLWAYLTAFLFGSFFVVSSALVSLFSQVAPPSAYNNHIVLTDGSTPPRIPLHTNIIVIGFSILGLELLVSGMRYVLEHRRQVEIVRHAKAIVNGEEE